MSQIDFTLCLFVGNLDNEVTESKVRSTFEKYGKVSDVEIKKQKDGYTAYGFVKFSDIQVGIKSCIQYSLIQLSPHVTL